MSIYHEISDLKWKIIRLEERLAVEKEVLVRLEAIAKQAELPKKEAELFEVKETLQQMEALSTKTQESEKE